MSEKISLHYHNEGKDLFACINERGELTSYSHIGQHSDICLAYVRESSKLTLKQIRENREAIFLLHELNDIGYQLNKRYLDLLNNKSSQSN